MGLPLCAVCVCVSVVCVGFDAISLAFGVLSFSDVTGILRCLYSSWNLWILNDRNWWCTTASHWKWNRARIKKNTGNERQTEVCLHLSAFPISTCTYLLYYCCVSSVIPELYSHLCSLFSFSFISLLLCFFFGWEIFRFATHELIVMPRWMMQSSRTRYYLHKRKQTDL